MISLCSDLLLPPSFWKEILFFFKRPVPPRPGLFLLNGIVVINGKQRGVEDNPRCGAPTHEQLFGSRGASRAIASDRLSHS